MDPSVLPAGPLEPCSLAVPVRVAVSVTGSPKATGLGRPALVVSVDVTDWASPICTPPVSHSVVDDALNGPQRWNVTDPLNVETPVTSTSALSLTSSVPEVGIVSPSAGMGVVPSDSTGVVFVVDVHSPSAPRSKSNSVAVGDCEERVSPMKTLKHLPASLDFVRLSPPSKNSEAWRVWPTPSVLFAVSHGVVIGPLMPPGHPS